jgi:cytochrome b561
MLIQEDIMSVRTRYFHGAMLLHWVIAALILTNLVLGWRMSFLKGLAQFDMFQLHKSVGITVLVLSILRLGWRLTHPAPALFDARSGLPPRPMLGRRSCSYRFRFPDQRSFLGKLNIAG